MNALKTENWITLSDMFFFHRGNGKKYSYFEWKLWIFFNYQILFRSSQNFWKIPRNLIEFILVFFQNGKIWHWNETQQSYEKKMCKFQNITVLSEPEIFTNFKKTMCVKTETLLRVIHIFSEQKYIFKKLCIPCWKKTFNLYSIESDILSLMNKRSSIDKIISPLYNLNIQEPAVP